MGEAIFRKVFPYFFPLADSYVRAIRYIRYNLDFKMDLMIRNVVYLEFMDRVKQIRIPHPLPKNADTHSGICIFYLRWDSNQLNATCQWQVAREGLTERHQNFIESLI